MEGTPFGRYTLLAKLGQGGMGEVWRAYDTETSRTVAIKLLPQNLVADPAFQERFRREARIASSLNEPHVIPIHHFGEINGRLYVDMRLIDGPDLATIIARGPLSPPRAVTIIEGIASALNAAHQAGLVHRDVKPSNILVVDDDFAYLIDFGIARKSNEGGLTSTGATIGTWTYMAPERFTTGEADARSDTYALACVLHETLTGGPPFPGTSMEQQVAGHLTRPPPRPSSQVPGVSRAMDHVIATGMAKDPNQRYATTRAFAQAARAALLPAPPTMPAIDLGPQDSPYAGPTSPVQPFPGPQDGAYAGPPSAGQPFPAVTQYRPSTPPPYGPPPWQPPAYPGGPPNAYPPKPSRSKLPLLIGAVVVAIVAVVAAVLVVVNRDSGTTTASSSSLSSATSFRSSTSTTSSSSPTTTRSAAPGTNPTIATYIEDNGIVESKVEDGDAGAPKLDLPIPDGWEPAGDTKPPNAYGAIIYKGPDAGTPPPRIIAIFSKLTGNVSAQEILDLAPGELNNLKGFTASNGGVKSTLAGYPAFVLGGTVNDNGKIGLIAQKTVTIPVADDVYVLQLNAFGNEGQDAIMGAATDEIDAKTKITV
ncbi:MAG: LpqN/LpqT family lipoprotein [Mycobacterium sp.]